MTIDASTEAMAEQATPSTTEAGAEDQRSVFERLRAGGDRMAGERSRGFSERAAIAYDAHTGRTPKLAALASRMVPSQDVEAAGFSAPGAASGQPEADAAPTLLLRSAVAASPEVDHEEDAAALDRLTAELLLTEHRPSVAEAAPGGGAVEGAIDLLAERPDGGASIDPFGPPPAAVFDTPDEVLSPSRQPRLRIDDLDPYTAETAEASEADQALWGAEPSGSPSAEKKWSGQALSAAFTTPRAAPIAIAAVAMTSAMGLVAIVSSLGGAPAPVQTAQVEAVKPAALLDAAALDARGLTERHHQATAAVRLAAVIEGLPGQLSQVRLREGAAQSDLALVAESWFALPSGACAQRRVDLDVDPAVRGVDAVRVRRFGPASVSDCPVIATAEGPQVASATTDDPLVTGDIPAPASFVEASALKALLTSRPIKCVDPAVAAATDRPRLSDGCAERTEYDLSLRRFTTIAPMESGLRLEISGALEIDGDEVCHVTRELSALVIGAGMSDEAALSYERAVEARFAKIPGGKICHRFRSLGVEHTFSAETYVLGRPAPERGDARAFELRDRS